MIKNLSHPIAPAALISFDVEALDLCRAFAIVRTAKVDDVIELLIDPQKKKLTLVSSRDEMRREAQVPIIAKTGLNPEQAILCKTDVGIFHRVLCAPGLYRGDNLTIRFSYGMPVYVPPESPTLSVHNVEITFRDLKITWPFFVSQIAIPQVVSRSGVACHPDKLSEAISLVRDFASNQRNGPIVLRSILVSKGYVGAMSAIGARVVTATELAQIDLRFDRGVAQTLASALRHLDPVQTQVCVDGEKQYIWDETGCITLQRTFANQAIDVFQKNKVDHHHLVPASVLHACIYKISAQRRSKDRNINARLDSEAGQLILETDVSGGRARISCAIDKGEATTAKIDNFDCQIAAEGLERVVCSPTSVFIQIASLKGVPYFFETLEGSTVETLLNPKREPKHPHLSAETLALMKSDRDR